MTALILACSPCAESAQDPCVQASEALAQRDLERAESFLLRCKAAQPQNPLPYLQLCGIYQVQGRTADLTRVAAEGMKRFPHERRFYLTVGTHAGREKQYPRAIQVFSDGLRRWPEDESFRKSLADSHASLGMQLLDSGMNAEAERHLRLATELAPDDIEAHLNLGRALHNLNRSTEALASFDKVLQFDDRLPLAHFHRGMVLYGVGEFEASVGELQREIKLNPEYPPSYLFLGLAYVARGSWTEALAHLETAAERMPDNAKAQFSHGRCLAQLGRTAEAERIFRRTMQLDPTDSAPVNALARLLLADGREEEAREMFRKSAELSRQLRSAAPGEIRFESSQSRKPQ